jgi:hypothetical protein
MKWAPGIIVGSEELYLIRKLSQINSYDEIKQWTTGAALVTPKATYIFPLKAIFEGW